MIYIMSMKRLIQAATGRLLLVALLMVGALVTTSCHEEHDDYYGL